jgi:hypothetical protein
MTSPIRNREKMRQALSAPPGASPWRRGVARGSPTRTLGQIPEQADRPGLERSVLYSEELGIELSKNTDRECFRWFLASVLFGARISETIAKNTYRAFVRHGLASPRAIIRAGWEFLMDPIMREGGYVRYDGRKSTQVLRDCETLVVKRLARRLGIDLRAYERKSLRFIRLEAGLIRMRRAARAA